MPIISVKITRKGQVTIPKEMRDKLKATSVYFEMENDVITIKPVKDAAGSLSEYAGNIKHGHSMEKMKDMAWEEAARERTGNQSS